MNYCVHGYLKGTDYCVYCESNTGYSFSPTYGVNTSTITINTNGPLKLNTPKEKQMNLRIQTQQTINGYVGQIVNANNDEVVWESKPYQPKKFTSEHCSKARDKAEAAAKKHRDDRIAATFE